MSTRRPIAARARRRTAGLASVEAVFALPFLLFFTLAVLHSTKLLHLKSHTEVEARNAAWNRALGSGGLLGGVLGCSQSAYEYRGGRVDRISCPTDRTQANRVLREMEQAGGRPVRGMTDDVRTKAAARRATGRVVARYRPWGLERLGTIQVESVHGLDAVGQWSHDQLPIGYDRWLERKLDAPYLFPKYFPKAR